MRTAIVLLCGAMCALAADSWRDQGVIYLNNTPNAKMHPVPVRAVTIKPGFWSSRREVNVANSIPTMYQLLDEHGVLDNFRRMSGRSKAPRRGPVYTDSDIYKWIEAAAFALQSADDPKLWGWPIFPPGFKAPALMELAKRQAWTLKPAILHKE